MSAELRPWRQREQTIHRPPGSLSSGNHTADQARALPKNTSFAVCAQPQGPFIEGAGVASKARARHGAVGACSAPWMALGQVMKGKIMKTIVAAAIASLMLSGAAFAAAPMMGNGPKPSVQATGQGDVLLRQAQRPGPCRHPQQRSLRRLLTRLSREHSRRLPPVPVRRGGFFTPEPQTAAVNYSVKTDYITLS